MLGSFRGILGAQPGQAGDRPLYQNSRKSSERQFFPPNFNETLKYQ